MKICHIDTEMRWRGGQRQVLYLLGGLKERGVDATLVTAPNSTLAAKAEEIGVPVQEIPVRGEIDPAGIARVRKFVKDGGFDIIHAHASHSHGIAVAVAATLSGVKTVIHRRVDFRPGRDVLNRIKYRTLPDRFIAISREIARVLIEAGVDEERIDVVHSAVMGMTCVPNSRDLVLREFRLPPQTVLIGNVAALTDHKGHRYLIDAAKILCRENSDIRFVLVGRGELEEELKERVAQLDLSEKVIFTGFREDVDRLMCAFDLFVMTSHLEGLNTSILDAMSVGTPVVVTDAGGMPEIVRNRYNGLLAETRDPISIAGALAQLLNDRELREHVVEGGFQTVQEEFCVDKMVDKTIAVYERLLAE